MVRPEISLLVSTFERPAHLQRCLLSIACQKTDSPFEVVVTDDGSADGTRELVAEFARTAKFPVRFTTHTHDGFRLAQCRNEGVQASSSPYILFLDGDCVLPADHIACHLKFRKPGTAVSGDCCRLEEDASATVDESMIRLGGFQHLAPRHELGRLAKQHRKAWWYNLINHATKPKLVGNNIGVWREDYERINGYDERFVGWGCEDDDLGIRLKRNGVRIRSILNRTFTYHLWHESVPSEPQRWRDGNNVNYLRRNRRLTRCRHGLTRRESSDLLIRVVQSNQCPALDQLLRLDSALPAQDSPEVEVLVGTGAEGFRGDAEFNMLVITGRVELADDDTVQKAEVLVSDQPLAGLRSDQRQFSFGELDAAFESIV